MRSLIMLAVLVLFSCVAVAGDEFENPVDSYRLKDVVYEVEPNNDAGTANPLVVGDEMNAAINVGGDVDWFAFAALAGEEVTFETHPGDVGSTLMAVIDVDGRTKLAEVGTDGSGGY